MGRSAGQIVDFCHAIFLMENSLPPSADRHAQPLNGDAIRNGATTDRWRWPRRLAMTGALVLGIAFVVYALGRSPESTTPIGAVSDPAVLSQSPSPGSHVLHQTAVGAKLANGYDGRIIIDGVEVPEDQMDGAAPVDSPAYDPRYGVRPNNKNSVFFTPGSNKVITKYPAGEVHVTVRFWSIAKGEASARTVSWAFFVN